MDDMARGRRARLTNRAYNAITRDDFTPESIQAAVEALFDRAFREGIGYEKRSSDG